jgi:hypothetical protein
MNPYKKTRLILLFPFIGFFLLFTSCIKEKDVSQIDFGYDFHPAEDGSWYIYAVTVIKYSEFTPDTSKYQLLEFYESTITDNQGREAFRFERYRKYPDQPSWEVSEVWQSILLPQRLERTEENQRIIKLVFPVRRNQTWDGNAYNTLPSQEFYYHHDSLFISKNIQGITYENTVTVIQEEINTGNVVRIDFADECYAKGVGLIQKRKVNLSTNVLGVKESGTEYYQELISFGHKDNQNPFEL